MRYKINVQCTKEHLEKAKYCGSVLNQYGSTFTANVENTGSNCWVSVALNDIFPKCWVSSNAVLGYMWVGEGKFEFPNKELWSINLPRIAGINIAKFDACTTIEEREALEPFSFDIEFDQQTFETILECNGFKCQQDFATKVNSTKHLVFSEC